MVSSSFCCSYSCFSFLLSSIFLSLSLSASSSSIFLTSSCLYLAQGPWKSGLEASPAFSLFDFSSFVAFFSYFFLYPYAYIIISLTSSLLTVCPFDSLSNSSGHTCWLKTRFCSILPSFSWSFTRVSMSCRVKLSLSRLFANESILGSYANPYLVKFLCCSSNCARLSYSFF